MVRLLVCLSAFPLGYLLPHVDCPLQQDKQSWHLRDLKKLFSILNKQKYPGDAGGRTETLPKGGEHWLWWDEGVLQQAIVGHGFPLPAITCCSPGLSLLGDQLQHSPKWGEYFGFPWKGSLGEWSLLKKKKKKGWVVLHLFFLRKRIAAS